MKKQYLSLAFAVCLAAPAFAQKKNNTLPEFQIRAAETEAHMRFLAGDELLGRRTGEQGNRVAARYIAEQFRKWGLRSVHADSVSGTLSYYQPISFDKMAAGGSGEITADAEVMKSGDDWILMSGGAAAIKAPIVYAAYGLEDASKGWDDYKGLDVKGKIVLLQSGSPDTKTPSEIAAASAEKRKVAIAKGAVAIIELFNAAIPWNVVTKFFGSEKISLSDDSGLAAGGAGIPHAWINGKESRYARALRGAKEVEFKTTGRITTKVTSSNVIGLIPGTDPKLKDEYILLTAHYDHIGVGKQGGSAYTPADSIFNGARDNAIGTVALLAAAESFSKNPPKRSVLVVALTAEEVGLLGSRYYAAHPLLPLNKCIFNMNSDGAGYTDTTIVAVTGLNRTGASAEIEAACKAFGLTVFADPAPEQGLFDRSDNVSFAKEGIPAPQFTPGFKEFNADLMKNYHQATDNPETIDFNYLLKFSQAYTYASRLIADRKTAPMWSAGDKYEPAAKKLYGK
ncbi:M28 family peptidase [Dyadobacter sandarakinus]|uniref:M28 family peptidase n=1 Tax=Dyadobacter sandarakinus TaxID=2747268 RepID=A0ABX7ICB7_9BACT|nr:M28 family peptidase [Dyadobacter sandarakinus]QRR02778.1 M28 family peptidase [Dyadobacter sandarakinus]